MARVFEETVNAARTRDAKCAVAQGKSENSGQGPSCPAFTKGTMGHYPCFSEEGSEGV